MLTAGPKVQNRPQFVPDPRTNASNAGRSGDGRPHGKQNIPQKRQQYQKADDSNHVPILVKTMAPVNRNTAVPPHADGSDALRKLLGISFDARNNETESSIPHTTQIDLNAMFNKANIAAEAPVELPTSLPQPPANWHAKKSIASNDGFSTPSHPIVADNAAQASVQLDSVPQLPQQPVLQARPMPPMQANFRPHQALQPHMPNGHLSFANGQLQHPRFMHHQPMQNRGMPMMHPNGPAVFQHASMMQHANQISTPPNNIPPFMKQGVNLFQRQPYQLPPAFGGHPDAMPGSEQSNMFGPPKSASVSRQRPDGPHNLSNNSKYLPGNGAFIPLQAARKIVKPKPATVNHTEEPPAVASAKVSAGIPCQ